MKPVLTILIVLLLAGTLHAQTRTPADSSHKQTEPVDTFVVLRLPLELYRNLSGVLAQMSQKYDQQADNLLNYSQEVRKDSKTTQQLTQVFQSSATVEFHPKKK